MKDTSKGFIVLYRQFLDWEWFTDIKTCHLFLYCLLRANHKDTNWHGIEIKKGSFVTSYENLSIETGLTVRQIRTALNKLKTTGEVTHKGQSRYSIISIKNWNEYQENDKQNDKQMTSKRQANDKQTTTDNNDNNETNIIYAHFEKFYEAYPKKKSRQAAERAFNSAIKKVDFETIMKGLNAYKEEIKRKQTEEQYIKYPATWLNQGCWDDTYQQEPKYEERPYRAIGNDYKWGGETFDYENEPYRGNR